MYHCTKISIADLNPHLMCVLCGGYFIDATTIIECLHSFCRTCIVRYLESSKFCPICDVQVHKTRPLLNIRSDKTLQDLVYKLVPGLFEKEMLRRREFLSQHPEIPTLGMDLEQRGMAHLVPAHSLPEERISLVLQLVAPAPSLFSDPRTHSITSLKPRDRRYLLCPSDVTIGHLKKFVRIKFGLPEKYQIDVFYKQSEETINDDFTLLDVTFIYSWNRKKPLRLCYSVYEKPRRKRKLTAAARSLVSRPSPAKKARLEDRKMTHSSHLDHLNKTSVSSSLSSGRAMMSAVKNKLNVQQSSSRTAKLPGRGAFCSKGTNTKLAKMKKDAWKKRSSFGGKIPGRINASFHGVQKNGAGRKKMVPTTKSVTAGSFSTKLAYRKDSSTGKLKEKNGNTKSDTKLFNGKPNSVFSNGSKATVTKAKNIKTHSSKPTKNHVSKVNGSVSPTLSASFYRKSASASATAVSSGRIGASNSDGPKTLKMSQLKQSSNRSSSPRLPVTNDSRCSSPKLLGLTSKDKNSPSSKLATNGASRSGSPRLSVSNGSRSGSPRLLRELESSNSSRSGSPRFSKVSETNGSRSGSPRLSSVGDRGSRSGSPRLLNGKTDSPKTSSGYTTVRTVTAKHSDIHRVRSSPLFTSVPVEERITIDVTTSSETSSDVTSPGAEDRANSTGLEEPEDFDAGGHVCNVAVFAPRPLPSLVHIPHNGLRHSGKSGVKDSAKVSRPSHVDSDSKTHSNKKR